MTDFYSSNSIVPSFFEINNIIDRVLGGDFDDKQIVQNSYPSYPPINHYVESDTGTNVIEFGVSGLSEAEVSVRVKDNVLIVSSNKTETPSEKNVYICRKLAHRKFDVQFKLSDKLDTANIEAVLKNGLLRVTIPLKETAKPVSKTIDIKTA